MATNSKLIVFKTAEYETKKEVILIALASNIFGASASNISCIFFTISTLQHAIASSPSIQRAMYHSPNFSSLLQP
jgi:hypothetical protein